MVPMIENPERALKVVEALHFPPLGERSYGGRRIGDMFGRNYHIDNNVVFVAQIETEKSIDAAPEIIAIDGVDVLFFSPDDMRVRMGLPINTPLATNEKLLGAMERTASAAHAAKKWCGCVIGDDDSLRAALRMGYQLIVGGSDIVFLRSESQRRREVFGGIVENRPVADAKKKVESAY